MSGSIEENILQAIERDDVKAFNGLMMEAHLGRYRLGRFPVLSLLYLYDARRLISAYEDKFVKISAWEELHEPASTGKLFSDRAGKCLRLYLSEVITPLEMLLILDKTKRLKRVYAKVNHSKTIRARLQSIYSVKYALDIVYDENGIIIPRRPLSYRAKRGIIAACIACVAAVAIAIVTPITIVSLTPKLAEGEVAKLSQIDFSAQTTYTLKRNIKIPKNYSVEAVNCTIVGDGNKLTLGKNASLGTLNGELSDLEIQTSGTPVFKLITATANLSNVTVNVKSGVKASADSAFVAVTNYGTIEGVTLNVSGKLSAVKAKESTAEEQIFGGMVAYNQAYTSSLRGTIKNCTVNYTNFSLAGEVEANASYGGIVGLNNGEVKDCTVTGIISSDTFDLAGACYFNNYLLSGIVNEADLSQVSVSDGWSPIVGGIVIESWSRAEYCVNRGNITVDGQSTAICGGIVARTYGKNNYCISSGNITVTAPTAYVGGIFGRSEVDVEIVFGLSYVYAGFADHCISEGKISVALGHEDPSCIGGIGGLVQERRVNLVDGAGNIVEISYYGGGITDCIFLGAITESFDYSGNVLGACGEDIYDMNSYTSDNNEYPNFEGNYFIENGLPSFGAVYTSEEDFEEVEGKGATSATEAAIKDGELYKEITEKLGK